MKKCNRTILVKTCDHSKKTTQCNSSHPGNNPGTTGITGINIYNKTIINTKSAMLSSKEPISLSQFILRAIYPSKISYGCLGTFRLIIRIPVRFRQTTFTQNTIEVINVIHNMPYLSQNHIGIGILRIII